MDGLEADVFAVRSELQSVRTKIVPIPTKEGALVETIVTFNKSLSQMEEKPPCISIIHGGPHTSFFAEFMPPVAALVLQGCKYSPRLGCSC